MQVISYEKLQETLYYEQLANGLRVYLLPKPDYTKTYATFTTKYGSIDNSFQLKGQQRHNVVDGIAHFLEHKMFEQENGEDVFQEFAQNGASANAFTSFTRTAYLFSCTSAVKRNLTTLLNYVQSPYFTEENVEKEKGIIGQEIQMYQDNPDWRVYFGLIEALYQVNPVRIDIAGTIESITAITKESLYTCYNTFYHPNNMLLFVVGQFDPGEIMQLIKANQSEKEYPKMTEILRFYPDEPDRLAAKLKQIDLQVNTSKCYFGFKEAKAFLGLTGDRYLIQEQATKLMLEALVGTASELYQELYNDGLVDDSFSVDYSLEQQFGFSMLGGETGDHERLLSRFEQKIKEKKGQGISHDVFERIRRKKIGSYLRHLNSPEWIANQFTQYRFRDSDLFQVGPILEKLTLGDINKRLSEHIVWDHFAISLIKA